MAYEKQNFEDGQVLTAAHLNNMEDELARQKTWDDLGYSPTGGDTLTWDGNTEGLVSSNEIEGVCPYKISGIVPNMADLSQGASITLSDGTITDVSVDGVVDFSGEGVPCIMVGEYCLIALEDNVSFDFTLPEKGVYFPKTAEDAYVSSLTIPGYTGFPSVNKVPEKYLPETTWDTLGQKPTVFLEETTVTLADGFAEIAVSGQPANGSAVTLEYNGTVYNTTAFLLNGNVTIGNAGMFGGEDTGEPFVVLWTSNTTIMLALSDAAITECTLKIAGNSVVKIPATYYDFYTRFFASTDTSDVYLYLDGTITTKATSSDFNDAVGKGVIVVVYNGCIYYPSLVENQYAIGGIGHVRTAEATPDGRKDFYTAEYTAS